MDIPPGWILAEGERARPWTRRMLLRRPDGLLVEWSAWHHRKGLGLLDAATRRPVDRASASARRRNGWIAALFAVGSACFALGSVPVLAAGLPDAAAGVFFVGSVFFTAAAYLQFHEASNAGRDLEGRRRTARIAWIRSESIGWWAAAIQLVGTVAFNVSTLAAVFDLSTRREETLVWAPDVVGSICFLVSSALAVREACSRWVCWEPRSATWWIASVNLGGSVAFGVSAVAARILPTTGEPTNIAVVNAATFVGAVLFLVGAALLPHAVSGRAAGHARIGRNGSSASAPGSTTP